MFCVSSGVVLTWRDNEHGEPAADLFQFVSVHCIMPKRLQARWHRNLFHMSQSDMGSVHSKMSQR